MLFRSRPTLSVTGQVQKQDSESFTPGSTVAVGNVIGLGTIKRTNEQVVAQVTQPVFRGFKTVAGTSQAKNQVYAQRARLEQTEAQVMLQTATAYLDVMQALEDLGIDEAHASEIGLRVYKVGMVWPLEREGIRHFAEGLEEILVVEEKRAVIENQMKEQLYNWREDVRPRVIGKFDEQRNWILPSADELTPARIARVIAEIGRAHV